MEKINNLDDLKSYLKNNLSEEDLFSKEDESLNGFDNFQKGFNSGYANAYANLLFVCDEDFKASFLKSVDEITKELN